MASNGFLFSVKAQEVYATETDTLLHPALADSIFTGEPLKTDTLPGELVRTDTLHRRPTAETPSFKPNSKRAVIYSAIFPGLGQVYNRKYWKLPLVYGGYMGFMYAITWNNKNYQDYTQAYYDVSMDDPNDPDSWHDSWITFVPAGRDPETYLTDSNFKSRLKNGRDYYRRYRDLSIILTIGWYFICMADTYVDAQLFDFDISPDLSLRLEPVVTPATRYSASLYGFTCSIKF
jgi:hypothetical protein